MGQYRYSSGRCKVLKMRFHRVRAFDESGGCNHVAFTPRRPSLKSKWVVVGRRDDDDDDDDHHYRGVPIRWPRCCSTDDSRTLISSRLSLTHSLFLPYYLILSPFTFASLSLSPSRHRQCEITNVNVRSSRTAAELRLSLSRSIIYET